MNAKLTATRNYDLFEVLQFNRNVTKTKKLEESMKRHGFLPAYPLHVVRNGNGKLKIKAGHHRFTAAKNLGISVYYVIGDDSATIYELESGTVAWSPHDYLTSFCRCGASEYLKVAEYMERTGIPIQCAVSMLGGHTAGSGSFTDSFKSGTFRVVSTKHAETVGRIVCECKRLKVDFACHSLFVAALSRVVWLSEFDADQFIRRVTANPYMCKRQPTRDGYCDLIEAIYNRNSHSKVPLAFLAKQAMQSRCPIKQKTAKAS